MILRSAVVFMLSFHILLLLPADFTCEIVAGICDQNFGPAAKTHDCLMKSTQCLAIGEIKKILFLATNKYLLLLPSLLLLA